MPKLYEKIPIKDDIIMFPVDSDPQEKEIELRDIQAKSWYEKLTDLNQQYKKNKGYSLEISKVINFLNLKKSDTVLDIGCGAGKITREIYKKSAFLVASDFSIECFRVLKEITGMSEQIALIRGNANDIKFKENSFDKVICTGVIQHIKDKKALDNILGNISDAMKNGGTGIFTVYNYNYSKKKQKLEQNGYFTSSASEGRIFRHFYDKRELLNLLEKYFIVERIIGIDNRLPFNLTGRLGKLGISIDSLISATPAGLLFGHLLLAVVRK